MMGSAGTLISTFLYTNRQGIRTLKSRTVFLILFLLAFLLRLPFFFRDYIDRDESTFILLGQSWVDGHLPYTELWDLKPPLVYLFFAGLIALFGKSFVAIRFAGVLVVAITAFFTYAMGKQLYSAKAGVWAAVGTVCLLSLFGSLQGLMSEHLSMLFYMPGLYLLLQNRNPWNVLGSGLFMGMAVMTKLNLAFAAALPGLFLFYEGIVQNHPKKAFGNSVLFGIGLLFIISATCLPYALEGNFGLWWNSVVLAPLEYTEARRYSVFKLAPIVLVTATFFYVAFKRKWLSFKDPGIQLLSLAILGVVLSYIKGGRVNGHYLIQFHPLFLVLLALVADRAVPPLPSRWRPFLAAGLLLLPLESYKEYYDVTRYRVERGQFFNGEGFSVPAYLKQSGMDHHTILFLEYHIGYWLLDRKPPTKAATHPSNLCRDELYPFYGNPRKTSMEELAYIMDDLKPEIVVTRTGRRIFDKKEEAENQYMVAYLKNRYEVVALIDRAEIHRRLK